MNPSQGDHLELRRLIEAALRLTHDRLRLDLTHQDLKEIPESLVHLLNVRDLDLSENGLSSLPSSIGRLSNLEELTIRNNKLHSLPVSTSKLRLLRRLDLSGNRFSGLPTAITKLGLLQHLELSQNRLDGLPETIGLMRQLEQINASSNKLTALPESVGDLSKLGWLNVSNNQLFSLPVSLRSLHSLKALFLHGNPSLGIPQEILGPTASDVLSNRAEPANPDNILEYYFRTRGDSLPLNEAKLIVIGRGEVGKTCLVNRLLRNEFVDTRKTKGISITQWSLALGTSENVRLHVWDFGGQEIMHATHQFFLSHRSLYLLVLNGRQGGEDADAEYWLQLIESFGGDSPVLVVLNKIREHPFDLNRRGLQGKYPAVKDFIRIDCEDGTGIRELRSAIERETSSLPDLRVPFPRSWLRIKDRLSNMAERGENYITFESYRSLCLELGESDESAQGRLAGYLHSLGIALNYREDPRLNDTHVLSPRWVTNCIYTILNWPELERRNGELHTADLGEILDGLTYPRAKHAFILDLMKKFQLCFEFPDDSQRFLVPELLGKEEPDAADWFKPIECLNFQYHYNILPEGLLPRFVVRTYTLSEGTARWRTGVILEFEGCRALVKADVQARRVYICVTGSGERRRRLLAVVRSDFERLHSDIRKLRVEPMVPVPGKPSALIPYSKLSTFEERKLWNYHDVFDGEMVIVDVQELLYGVDIPGARSRREGDLCKVFISYSHVDEGLRAEMETHLKLLQREGSISVWHDRRITAGQTWAAEIDRNLEEAQLVLLLVSSDFIASDYCWESEMTFALKQQETNQTRVVPVIIRDVNWAATPFARFQALPKDGLPVTLWPSRDSAWKDVAAGIQKIAQEVRRGF